MSRTRVALDHQQLAGGLLFFEIVSLYIEPPPVWRWLDPLSFPQHLIECSFDLPPKVVPI